ACGRCRAPPNSVATWTRCLCTESLPCRPCEPVRRRPAGGGCQSGADARCERDCLSKQTGRGVRPLVYYEGTMGSRARRRFRRPCHPMHPKLKVILAAVLLPALVAGCGFALQGAEPLPSAMARTYLETDEPRSEF